MLKMWGLKVKGLQSYRPSNFENDSTSPGFEPGPTGSVGPWPDGILSTLTTGSFKAIRPKDFKFSAIEDLNHFK